MPVGTELNLVPDTKPIGGSIVVNRRQRLIKAINTQIAQIRDELSGEETFGRKKPSWHWLDEKGVYYVSLRYGKKSLELSKGKYAVMCATLEDVSTSLDILKEYVSKGEYDEKMNTMAKSIRTNFKR